MGGAVRRREPWKAARHRRRGGESCGDGGQGPAIDEVEDWERMDLGDDSWARAERIIFRLARPFTSAVGQYFHPARLSEMWAKPYDLSAG